MMSIRLALDTAIPLVLPESIIGLASNTAENIMSMLPPIMSVAAGIPPL